MCSAQHHLNFEQPLFRRQCSLNVCQNYHMLSILHEKAFTICFLEHK